MESSANPAKHGFFSVIGRTAAGLWGFFSPEIRRRTFSIAALSTVLAGFPVLRTAVYSALLNLIVELAKTRVISQELLWVTVALMAIDLVQSILRWQVRSRQRLIWTINEQYVGLKVWEKLGSLDVATFDDPKKQVLISKARQGDWRLRNYVEGEFDLISSAFRWIFAGGALVWTHPGIFAVAVIGCLPEMLVEFYYGGKNWKVWDDCADDRRRYRAMEDFFGEGSPISEMKIFQTLRRLLKIGKERSDTYTKADCELWCRRTRSNSWANLFANFVLSLVAVWGIYLVWKGQIDLGGFTFLMGTVGIARDSMAQFFGSVARQYENALFADDFLEMMRLEPMIKNPATGIKIDSIQRIEFEHVSFAYPGGRGEVLHDISFELSCGDKVALVGLNGSGKTTLIKLLCRFYDPTSGRVLVNGIDLRELELESYYARMSALFQEYLNYRSFNVSEAIEFGRSDRELDVPKRDQAASDSESADFIREFANGYDQILGKWFTGGEGLSVGQWQKLALARAFYRGSDLLILDEPTASVDAQSEMKIFDKIASMGAQQTALFISHRFSTVLQANRIMMLEEGRITENGSHAELLANNRSYARLYRMQAKAFETTPPFN